MEGFHKNGGKFRTFGDSLVVQNKRIIFNFKADFFETLGAYNFNVRELPGAKTFDELLHERKLDLRALGVEGSGHKSDFKHENDKRTPLHPDYEQSIQNIW